MKWYNDLQKRPEVMAITCGSSKGFTSNTKNTHNKDNSLSERKLNSALWVINEFLSLPTEERKMVVKILSNTN
jgi:hypothetical protein